MRGWVCSACGADLKQGAAFCGRCGAAVVVPDASGSAAAVAAPARRPRAGARLAIVVGVVVIAAAGGFAAWYFLGSGSPRDGGTTTTALADTTSSPSTAPVVSSTVTPTTATPTTAPAVFGTQYRSTDELAGSSFVRVNTPDHGSCSSESIDECVLRWTVPAQRQVVLEGWWITDTAEQARDFLDAATCTASFDGTPIADVAAHWSLPEPWGDFDGDGSTDFAVIWHDDLGFGGPGVGTGRFRCDLSRPVSDGWVSTPAGTVWDQAFEIERLDIDLPDLVTEVLVAPKVVEFSDFTTLPASVWGHSHNSSCPLDAGMCIDGWDVLWGVGGQRGAVVASGEGTFSTWLHYRRPLVGGEALLVTFFYVPETDSQAAPGQDWGQNLEFFMDTGSWGETSYRRFGIGMYNEARVSASYYQGADWSDPGIPAAAVSGRIPYALLLAIDDDGRPLYRVQRFDLGTDWPYTASPLVWADQPSTWLGSGTWPGNEWSWALQVSQGTRVFMMSATLISFSGFSNQAATG